MVSIASPPDALAGPLSAPDGWPPFPPGPEGWPQAAGSDGPPFAPGPVGGPGFEPLPVGAPPLAMPIEDREASRPDVERLPTATQAHRIRLSRPIETDTSPRTADARLSRLHLRGGMLQLARAALEQMAGAGTLDRAAFVDLAETRWRNGDLEGAAEAAEAHLHAHGDEPLARVIAAEQSARDGRILDARQLATQVQGQVGEGVERLFAGEPRSAVWAPAAPGWMDAGAALPGRWGLLVGGEEVADPDGGTWPTAPLAGPADARIMPGVTPPHTARDAAPFRVSALAARDTAEASREADRQLEAAEHDLERGDLVTLADRLGLLLRRDPALAPVILSIAEHALAVSAERRAGPQRPRDRVSAPQGDAAVEPGTPVQGTLPWVVPGMASLQLLVGDIHRGLGHDPEATQAYQEALRALPGRAITMEST
jgi:hypothetical protein